MVSTSYSQKGIFFGLHVYDLLFYSLINFIGISLIIGTIVDGLAELRLHQERITASLKSHCFMCDLERGWFDRKFSGFEQHIKKQHNLRSYLAYIYSVKAKHPSLYSGIERAVMEKIIKQDMSWVPNSRAVSLEREGVFTEESQQLAELLSSLTKIDDALVGWTRE